MTYIPKQTGRSMIEMLAVLAIIGVLSILALAGLRYAMDKYKANAILNDTHLVALHVMDTGSNQLPSDFYADSGMTFEIDTTTFVDGFVVKVPEVSEKVCEKIMDMNVRSIEHVYVDTEGNETCGQTQALLFYFLYEGAVSSGSSGSGSLDLCEGKTCYNGGVCVSGVCSCVNGYTGSSCEIEPDMCYDVTCGPNGSCVNGVCHCDDGYHGDGYLCERCPDDKPLWNAEILQCVGCLTNADCDMLPYCNVHMGICQSCEYGYFLSGENCNTCPEPTAYRSDMTRAQCDACPDVYYNSDGNCAGCQEETNATRATYEECSKCPNRHWMGQAGQSGLATCAFFSECKTNGTVVDGLCTGCNEGYYFTGTDCSSCPTETGYKGGMTVEQCNQCPGVYYNSDSNCAGCQEETNATRATYEECSKCPNRHWMGQAGQSGLATCAFFSECKTNGTVVNGLCTGCNEGYILNESRTDCVAQ